MAKIISNPPPDRSSACERRCLHLAMEGWVEKF